MSMDLRDTYNRIAAEYLDEHREYSALRSSADMLLARLPIGSWVLEIGCGPGIEAKFLADHGMRVVATDFSGEMIRLARSRYPEIEFQVMDLMQPIAFPEPFDAIYAQAVLLHVPRAEAVPALRRLVSSLKPGGWFSASVKERWEGQPETEMKREDDYGYVYERFFQYYDQEGFRRLLTEVGLEPVESRTRLIGRTNWLQELARKPVGR